MPISKDQLEFGNDWERTVLSKDDLIDSEIYAREISRYKWADSKITDGMRVLEFGCSSGFGVRLLSKDIQYTGVDYSDKIISYAISNYADTKHAFICSDINAFLDEHEDEKWDVIIAFEVLEHIPNGKETAQRLKKHCNILLATVPYKEPVGYWGKHHVLHGLSQKDFPFFTYKFMHFNGEISDTASHSAANLMLMEWKSDTVYPVLEKVLCSIPTKDRYDSLMNCLQAVAYQTRTPDKVIIYDDGSHLDIRTHDIGRYILALLERKGIEWEVICTPGIGQFNAHQMANVAGYEYVWRVDDDNVPEPDVLHRLLQHIKKEGVGAVGGAVIEPSNQIYGGTSKILDFFDKPNMQWGEDQGMSDEVDFLYGSFLYKAGIVNYKMNMSPVSFHEETIFSHRLKLAGYKLIVDTSIKTYHFKSPKGGTRQKDNKWEYAYDNMEFTRIFENEWGYKLIHLDVGLGDNFAFKNIIPELKARYKKLIIATCYPDVFSDVSDVYLTSFENATKHSSDNIYCWMAERNWKGSLVDAYRIMYLG